MKAKSFLSKQSFMRCVLLFLCPTLCYGQSAFQALPTENNTTPLSVAFSSSDTIPLNGMGSIYSFSIDVNIHQPHEASFTRIVLEDTNGHDYLVAESNWFRFDTTEVHLSHYCEETAVLDGVTPAYLKCYLSEGSTATLTDIHTSSSPGAYSIDTIAGFVKEEQVSAIVDKINQYNVKHGRLWRAAITEESLLPFDEKGDYKNESNDSYLSNIQYYAGGFFEIGEPHVQENATASPFVASFDWRNRHGKNWLTPPKRQKDSAYCTAFAAVGMLESNLLLNYKYNENDTSAIDLSEQYVASYVPISYSGGIYDIERPVLFLKTNGTIDETSMPFRNYPYVPDTIPEGNEHVYLSDYDKIDLMNIPAPMDTLKKYLIHRGPGFCGYHVAKPYTHQGMGGHAMTLAGYGTVVPDTAYVLFNGNDPNLHPDTIFHEGDNYIGRTYWIYKNSRGPSWGHNQ